MEVEVPPGYTAGQTFQLEFQMMTPSAGGVAQLMPRPPATRTAEATDATAGGADEITASLDDARLCPITKQLMEDPYWCGDGVTYERSALVHTLWRVEREGRPLC